MDWVNGHAKLRTSEGAIATAQNLLREWWGRGVDLPQRVSDWAVHIFREHKKEAALWAVKGVKSEEEWVPRVLSGPRLTACVVSGTVVVNVARVVLG